MGKVRYAVLGGGILLAVAMLHSEEITAESNVFSFPEMVPVKMQHSAIAAPFFRNTALNPFARSVTFSWSLPVTPGKERGAIVIYSLLGRVVARIPVDKAAGSAHWDFRSSFSRSGIYLARLQLGGQVRNLKLMLWN
ncbi:MAG: T9SS type A sorting domain-containing protein [Chitinispirillaceae bacterium]|nr:T9SS type A sorting domain-containing protein [Chitinispirillaceae bacterium]